MPSDREATTELPPPPKTPGEERDTLTPSEEAIAVRIAELLRPELQALNNGVRGLQAQVGNVEDGQIALKKSIDGVHEVVGRLVVRQEGANKALETLANEFLVHKFISEKARGEIADHLALQPKAGHVAQRTEGGE